MSQFRTIALAVSGLLLAHPVSAQAIRGQVVDATSGGAVAEAAVTALDENQRAVVRERTNAAGEFALSFRSPGVFRVRVERTGYQTVTSSAVTVGPGESVQVEIKVSPSAVALAPLMVVGRQGPQRNPAMESTGFYEREARGLGRFYRREFFEARVSRPLTSILDEVPGVNLHTDRRGNKYALFDRAQTSGSLRSGGGKCYPAFFIDGVRVAVNPDVTRASDLVQADNIEAIEAYASASQLPVEYSGAESACGVIVIWTRRSR